MITDSSSSAGVPNGRLYGRDVDVLPVLGNSSGSESESDLLYKANTTPNPTTEDYGV